MAERGRVTLSISAPSLGAATTTQINEWGREERNGEMEDSRQLLAALSYAENLLWAVFPCHNVDAAGCCSCGRRDCDSPGKHPHTSHGLQDATKDPEQIRTWWKRWPDANIGVPTGAVSGFDVLDIDPRHGGNESLEELEREHGKLPETVEAITGGGGRHILFKHKGGVRNSAGRLPGLDVRGEGGYIIVAPSTHASGQAYAWELSSRPDEVELAEWPDRSLDALKISDSNLCSPAPPVGDRIIKGQRNEVLTSLAGTMRRREMSEYEIVAALLVANERRCDPPLPDEEVQRIAASVMRYPPEEELTLLTKAPSVSFVSASGGGFLRREWTDASATAGCSPAC